MKIVAASDIRAASRGAPIVFRSSSSRFRRLVGCQSVSVVKPHRDSTDNSRGNGQREEPPGLWQTDNAHREQADGDKQSNRVAGPKSPAVISKRNEFSGRRQVARILLKSNVTESHSDST